MSKRRSSRGARSRPSPTGRTTRRVHRTKAGAAPGTLIAPPEASATKAYAMAWGPDGGVERDDPSPEVARTLTTEHPVTWIDLQGLADVQRIEEFGNAFGLHPLALEDAFNSPQRAKLEEFDEFCFVIARQPHGDHGSEQIALFLGSNWVITLQERVGDCFEPLRERIRAGRPRLSNGGAGYLLYAMLDSIIDGWFPRVEAVRDRLDALEAELFEDDGRDIAPRIHAIKQEIGAARREIWPMRDVISGLLREDSEIGEENHPYLRDCSDHLKVLLDGLDAAYDAAGGLFDLHLSLTSHRMNEVMRVLTIIATLFIPLSFVAGLYGMNFDT
ncbi:MAG: magnesium/cobalt transporter CorA, partial [Gemmatimonadetes bacterium]|nr:magnesium/cobalt transporter CorA [Gemmatimonadota bacterium]